MKLKDHPSSYVKSYPADRSAGLSSIHRVQLGQKWSSGKLKVKTEFGLLGSYVLDIIIKLYAHLT